MSSNRRTRRFRPTFDVLEDRCLPAAATAALLIDPPPPSLFGPVASTSAPVAPTTFGSESAFVQHLINDALDRYKGLFGQPVFWWDFPYTQPINPGVPLMDAAASGSGDFSSTNVQVAGVDEGDLVKTDGNCLYVLSGQELVILRAQPADGLQVVSRTALEGQPSALYLDGNRVTVLSSVWPQFGPWPPFDGVGQSPLLPYHAMTKVTVLDVSDPAAPRTAREVYADGFLQSSRAVGDRVYVVLDNESAVLPPPAVVTDADGQPVYETQDQYLARLAGHETDLALPHLYTRPDGPNTAPVPGNPLTDPAAIYQPQSPDDTSLISVLAFDVLSDGAGPDGGTSAYAGYGSTVYATADHLYVVSPRGWWDADSAIYQFTLDGDHVDLTAAGVVPGRVLNQFSLDEAGGYLRVATTAGWESGASNGVYVLAAQAGVLTVVGSLEGLAPGEQIRATYFLGDRAYLVTSHYCDPLFIVDLSDPTAPRVAGQLQLPGYSTYLQPLDATHLLGVGRDGDGSLKIALFDVSDPVAPRQVDVYDISASPGSWPWAAGSPAEYDAHALSYFPETHTLALPVSADGWPWSPFPGAFLTDLVAYPLRPYGFAGVWSLDVFQVDPSAGFRFLGRIDQDSPVRRSLRIGGTLYSVADASVQARPLDDPTAPGTEARLDGEVGTIQGVLQSAAAGTPLGGELVEFTAADPSDLAATIDWGDGQTSAGDVVALGDGRYAVRAAHTYDSAGRFEYRVTFWKAGPPTVDPSFNPASVASFSGWVNVSAPAPPDDGGEAAAAAPATAPADPLGSAAPLAQALVPGNAPPLTPPADSPVPLAAGPVAPAPAPDPAVGGA